jgi:hypothetical protein
MQRINDLENAVMTLAGSVRALSDQVSASSAMSALYTSDLLDIKSRLDALVGATSSAVAVNAVDSASTEIAVPVESSNFMSTFMNALNGTPSDVATIESVEVVNAESVALEQPAVVVAVEPVVNTEIAAVEVIPVAVETITPVTETLATASIETVAVAEPAVIENASIPVPADAVQQF